MVYYHDCIDIKIFLGFVYFFCFDSTRIKKSKQTPKIFLYFFSDFFLIFYFLVKTLTGVALINLLNTDCTIGSMVSQMTRQPLHNGVGVRYLELVACHINKNIKYHQYSATTVDRIFPQSSYMCRANDKVELNCSYYHRFF